MQDERVHLKLLRGTDDTDPRDPSFQADLTSFANGLRREGLHYSQKAMAFDSVDVMGYPLPDFIAMVSPIAVGAIAGLVTLAKTWMETRPGRGIRYKDGDTFIEVGRVEDLPKLKAFLEDTKRLGEDF